MSARLRLRPENVALTHGGTAAVVLVQRSAVSAGDTIAVESPSHRLLLAVMRRWGHALAGDSDAPARRLVDRCAGLRSARLAALGAERGFTLIETDICSGRFDHVFRIHHGEPWSARLDVPLRRLGGIVAAPAAG